MNDEHLQKGEKQHKLILTGRGNKVKLRVRCKCMAEYRNVSDRYYNYDYIAEVDTIPEALAAYRRHLEETNG